MTLPKNLYYLADRHDRSRLMADGTIQAAHDGRPWYFRSEKAALAHPELVGLRVFSVPTVETLPGAPVGTRIEDAVDAQQVYQAAGVVVR